MLTPERLRTCTGEEGALSLLRDLGYPIAPVDIDPDEWRRGGVAIPWNGNARFRLAARMRRFDLFVLSGDAYAAQFHPLQERKQQEFTGRLTLGLEPFA